MLNEQTYNWIIYSWIAIGLITFLVLLKTTAPYGRHSKTTWGPMVDNRWSWFLMEFPVLIFLYSFIYFGALELSIVSWVLVGFFTVHYLHRSIIFPLRVNTNGKKMPLLIPLLAIFFNIMNGFQLGYYFTHFSQHTNAWFTNPMFVIGAAVFCIGFLLNLQADNTLINLRAPGQTGYTIPKGGLFNYISCPNLFGEMVEWLGFAIMAGCLPGWSFFIWTCANLIPRAVSHHKWYLSHFEDYPKNRKAVIPGIW